MLRQAIRIHHIVAIHARNVLAARQLDGLIQTAGQPPPLPIAEQPDAWIAERLYDLGRSIGRAIVHHHEFPVSVGLIQDRNHRDANCPPAVQNRHGDRDQR